ncbi:riboflavin synthase beta chain [Beijerinckiaceae bacterium RH AL1]|jgi:6,7-dimethyl-8-ribityllumazine synthase|nr:6,7-dimethyl-8-ribityllumazine synthase [Beijerinckiaceae bacterium]VVB44871.1 riboflavin synthase beta chain [Beijerinckiaceae bacterium RH CH11]VVB44950.1 riboflavin synthase beta chain [Beijerinckiaceae bacterium RH AL8]VVC54580.1 riboflavin synthase beta chain [Beijerinckiaceae bacterium RH AL1]
MAEPRRSASSPVVADGARFLIVEARFYDDIGGLLYVGARHALEAAGAKVDVISVPGALEIPIALAIALDHGDYDGAVALGCVIRGDTYHFEIVCNESARALTALAVERRLAFGNGILTVDREEQAVERADPKRGDKGGDAARAALKLWDLKQKVSG